MSNLVDITKQLQYLDVSSKVEKKQNLSYLTWSWAWDKVLSNCPNATYEVVKQENGLPYVYDQNTGYMVFTKVTIEGLTREMWLPVMNNSNQAMKATTYKAYGRDVSPATMFDVNKTIMRCLVKNLAMFGLGLYIYAGEDLPEELPKEPEKLSEERFNSALTALKENKITKATILAFDLTETQKEQLNK